VTEAMIDENGMMLLNFWENNFVCKSVE
jgi:hypothetical protein